MAYKPLTPIARLKDMKKIVLSLCVCLWAIVCTAQTKSFIYELNENVEKMAGCSNGAFYTVSWQPNCPDDYIVIRYMNRDGEEKYKRTSPVYLASVSSISCCVNNKNNLVLYLRLGDINHSLFEFDSTGNMLWNQNYQFVSTEVKFDQILNGPTGYYLIGNTYTPGFMDSTKAFIVKVDEVGKHQWNKLYNYNPAIATHTLFNKAMLLGDTLVTVGYIYPANYVGGQKPYRPTVSKLDTSGNFLSGKYYVIDSSMLGIDNYEFKDFYQTPAGYFYLVGFNYGNEHALFKMDKQFNIIRIKEKLSGKMSTMCGGYDENLFIVPDNTFTNTVYEMDSTLTIVGNHAIKKNNLDGTQYGALKEIIKHNCGFLFKNNYRFYGHADKSFTYCMDSSVALTQNYYTVANHYSRPLNLSITNYGQFNTYLTNQPYTVLPVSATQVCSVNYTCGGGGPSALASATDKKAYQIYPNPGHEYVTIRQAGNDDLSILVYGLNGTLLLQTQSHAEITLLAIKDFPSGIYLLKIQNKDQSIVERLIKE